MKAEQKTFEFTHHAYMGREDFIVSSCNQTAFRAVEAWPDWTFFALCLYGAKGCGKSHLANLFKQRVMENAAKLYQLQFIQASNIAYYIPQNLFAESPCLVIENFTDNIDNEAMFHLYNHYKDNGGYILILSEKAPSHLKFNLPDLQSRINAVPAIEIMQPDDEMITMLMLKLFMDRQLKVSPEVLNYAVNNMTRSFSFTQKLVAEADRISLIKKSPITINVIKEAIEMLNDGRQEDLFISKE